MRPLPKWIVTHQRVGQFIYGQAFVLTPGLGEGWYHKKRIYDVTTVAWLGRLARRLSNARRGGCQFVDVDMLTELLTG